jgi:alpha-mannosidase
VTRSVKVAVRRAEHLLEQAMVMAAAAPLQDELTSLRLDAAWRQVCFNHFHDTLGGTCIPSAYPQVEDALGAAMASADEILQMGLRRLLPALTEDPRQRIALYNAAPSPFEGYAELAPWAEAPWQPSWRIVDELGAEVPYQLLQPEAVVKNFVPRVLVRTRLPGAALQILAVERDPPTAPPAACAVPHPARFDGSLVSAGAVSIDLRSEPSVLLPGKLTISPAIALYDDPSDTWSHGIVRFEGPMRGAATWERPIRLDAGPLLAAALQHGSVGDSTLRAEWRVYADEPIAELKLRVHWRAHQQLLKLAVLFEDGIEARTDGVPGRSLRRELDGRERPIRDFTLLTLAGGRHLGIVCPEIFALDANHRELRLTLLRSPTMAHHVPAETRDWPRSEPADQGVHWFRILFAGGPDLDVDWLERRASALNFPLLSADWTRGMVTVTAETRE